MSPFLSQSGRTIPRPADALKRSRRLVCSVESLEDRQLLSSITVTGTRDAIGDLEQDRQVESLGDDLVRGTVAQSVEDTEDLAGVGQRDDEIAVDVEFRHLECCLKPSHFGVDLVEDVPEGLVSDSGGFLNGMTEDEDGLVECPISGGVDDSLEPGAGSDESAVDVEVGPWACTNYPRSDIVSDLVEDVPRGLVSDTGGFLYGMTEDMVIRPSDLKKKPAKGVVAQARSVANPNQGI